MADISFQISVYDSGPKLMALGTASSNAHKTFDIRVRVSDKHSLINRVTT